MARAKVYNDNTHPNAPEYFEQEFRGKVWRVPKGGSIEADYVEAMEFKGLYFDPVIKNLAHQPEGFKMIRVEKLPDETPADKPTEYVNHFTGEKFASKEEWEQSVKSCEGHLHDKAKEEIRKKRGRPSRADLERAL